MTVPTTRDAAGWLSKYMEGVDGDVDLARAMLAAFRGGADVSAGVGHVWRTFGERSEDRTNSRNGYRVRDWDTRVGTIDLAIPKLREGTYYPDWLLPPRRRAEQALVAVIGQAYVEGVSTRRLDDLVRAMGVEGISRSQVSRMAAELDAKVAEFRDRPLDAGPYRYLWIDALTQKVREGGRVVNVSAVIATAVDAEGRREIVGFDIVTTESTEAWTEFLRSLVARGLSGVGLVVSNTHGGSKAAIAAVLFDASWQRCRTHFMANLATRIPKGSWPMITTLVRSIFEQPDRDATWNQLGDVVDHLDRGRLPAYRRHLARRRRRHPGLRRLPGRALAQDPIQQPSRTPEQGDPPTHRCGWHLPQPGLGDPPRRRPVSRTIRRWAITKRYMSAETLKTAHVDGPCDHDPRPAIEAATGPPSGSTANQPNTLPRPTVRDYTRTP